MSRLKTTMRAAAIVAMGAAAAGCMPDADIVRPQFSGNNAIFESYVSLGNSIAAGVQSSGINDSTQKQSFAYLLADQMDTRFAVPFIPRPGCTPPVANWQTGARVQTGMPAGQTATAATCTLRATSSITTTLNNLAVPSAASTEVGAQTSPYHNLLTNLILGGKTQVQRAIEADPTFITIEIGPNDVLQAAYTGLLTATPGISRGITPFATFQTNYDKMLSDLDAGAPRLQGGVLFANVRTSSAPILFPAAAFGNPAFAAGFSIAATGSPAGLTYDADCLSGTSPSLMSFAILPEIRAGRHPTIISCSNSGVGIPAYGGVQRGNIWVLDAAEQATLDAAVTQMNTYIQGKATAMNFAYVDINPTLLAQKAAGGCINAVPNLAAAGTVSPFGTCISFDGLHPTLAGSKLIANLTIAAINAKYQTTLPVVP
jgi:hypothetical protein